MRPSKYDLTTSNPAAGTVPGRVPSAQLGSGPQDLQVTHPFKVINASSGGTAKVRVVFGQVNSVTPTIGGIPLDYIPPPLLAVYFDTKIILDVTVDGSGNVTAVDVNFASPLPPPTSTHAYLTLASVAASGSNVTAINQSVTQSLQMAKCGATTYYFGGV